MDITQENENESGDTAELYAAAAAADAGQPYTPTDNTDDASKKTGDASPEKTEEVDKQESQQGKTTDSSVKTPESHPAKPESQYQKAKRESREREAEAWKKINEEKERLKRVRVELESQRTQAQAPKVEEKEKGNASMIDVEIESWRRVAKSFDDDGNEELAEQARNKIEKLRKEKESLDLGEGKKTPASSVPPPGEPGMSKDFQGRFLKNAESFIQRFPELSKPDNPIRKTVDLLIANPRYRNFIFSQENGFEIATEISIAILQSNQAKSLQDELSKYKAMIAELEKKYGLTGAPAAANPAPAKSPGELSSEELYAMAIKADQSSR